MQKKLEEQILELVRKMKKDERKINGQKETDVIEDIRYIKNAIEIDGKQENIICMVLSKGKEESSYRYYINNELICVVDPSVAREPIFTKNKTKKQEMINEKLRLVIQNPEKFGKEEISAIQEMDENEKLIIKIANELGISKDEVKNMLFIDVKQKVHKKEEEEKQKEIEQYEDKKVYENDITVKQNLSADVKVDEMKTLGQTLKVSSDCERIAVIETYQLDDVDKNAKGSSRYSFVAINNDGSVELIAGLEEDHSVGNNSMQQTYKVEHDGNVEKNTILSRYTIDGTDATLSIRNGDMGQIEVFYSPDKSKNGNESLDKELQTDNVTWRTKTEMRDIAGHYDSDGDRKVDYAIKRAEGTEIEDNDDTEYKDLDTDPDTKSDNEQQIELDTLITLEDGSTTTIREEARKDKVSPEEFLNKYKQSEGESQEEKIENVHDEIENEYGGGERNRKR